MTFLRFCFSGEIKGLEDRALDREIVALHWLTEAEVKSRQDEHRSPLVQECLLDFLAGRRFPLDVLSREYG